ncbi:MAG: hypothetical protein NC427_12495 [Ruminococcus flavefaciens]|nr:hypothetical protein [Ruminococcus flavefaciens]
MKGKRFLALLVSVMLCVSLLAGCGKGNGEEGSGSAEPSGSTEESGGSEESFGEAESGGVVSADPLEMITEGYYSFTYPVDGMDDMCAFFHFYEEQPVIGAVFYAGFAWNQITYVGTYTVEEKEISYKCAANREDQISEPPVYREGTAPYTVTFYDFEGNELGACGYDGEILYNDTAISGTGVGDCMMYHDADPASRYISVYESEVGVPYLDFVAEDPTSTLTLYHNSRYLDLVDMLAEGSWAMEESGDGYTYTLTPDSDSDTGAVVMVAADGMTCVYTPEGGEGIPMTNTAAAGPKASLEMTGKAPIPGQEVEADLIGMLYDDGTVTLKASAFGSELDIDAGTWSMGADGYTITFQFEIAGELVSALGESGVVLRYVGTSPIFAEMDTELSIGFASEEPAAVMQLTGEIPVTEEVNGVVAGNLYDDGTVKLSVSAFDQSMDLDSGTYEVAEDGYTITFHFDNAGDITSSVGEAGAAIQYIQTGSLLGDIDTELVISVAG